MTLREWLRPVGHLVRKEFRQLRRDRQMLRMLLFMPIVQMLVLGYAITTDLRNIRLSVLDQDNSPSSRKLVEAFHQNNLFVHGPSAANPQELQEHLFRGRADLTLWIPKGYQQDLTAGRTAELGAALDGANSNAAGRTLGYAQAVVRQEEARLLTARRLSQPNLRIPRIEPVTRFFYNPELESRNYMIPAIMVILITMVSGMMSGMAVVREREVGTLEQLLVTPVTPGQLIAGKLIPYAALACVELTVATSLALLWFGLTFAGSPLLLFACALVYLIVTLGGGLLASTVSHTQQQAMFTIWFFTVFGILTSGFFYPVENMPRVIYYLTYANPLRFFMVIVRGIFLKGISLADALPSLLPLFIIGSLTLTVAVRRFHKSVA
jgi:ABC-2 type transport system permease protein